ncbi:MAG: 16S rRNA (uracil(1498)-N(3))-methyltransferase, partial [Spirochaetota bacterium]|nr:16S rRNA (uracil(1498)-N(3))-methyltransferase [Spirochaetota bacterium]
MKCLFIPDHSHDEENILLKGDDFHHIVKAHRLKTGEKLELKDSSFAYSCVTSNIRNDAVVFTILEKRILIPPTLNLTLCQAILKGDSFSFVLQKATELGVSKIIPYMAERSVVSIPPEEEDKKIVRWRKICEEAAKQCGRDNIPSVTEVNRDLGLLKCPADNRLVAYELENAHSLKDR